MSTGLGTLRQPDRFFADENCEIRVSGNEAVVHDRLRSRYLRTSVEKLPDDVRGALQQRPERITLPVAAILTTTVIAGWLSLLVTTSIEVRPGVALITGTGFILLASILVHEAAHVVVLRAFGKHVDHVGVKLNHWVFPALYVRMSQSIMLTRPQQVAVHLAGIAANVTTLSLVAAVNTLVWSSETVTAAVHITVVLLGWNLLPLLGSDGYRVLLAFSGKAAARRVRSNPVWLNLVHLLSVIVAAATAAHLVLTLLG
jgi:putative peptide zinc metalloprotease protein